VSSNAPHPKAPRPKTRVPGRHPLPPREKRKGLVIVNTGNGKGKTTAALGVLLRATGLGMTVGMFQFIKSPDEKRGEHHGAEMLGVEITPLGAGFTWLSDDLEHDRKLAREAWARCRAAVESGEYDVLIFDELTYAFTYDWLSAEEVFRVLDDRPKGTHVIITGRDATPELVEYADLVTEMKEIKHPYTTQGIGAQPGIEL